MNVYLKWHYDKATDKWTLTVTYGVDKDSYCSKDNYTFEKGMTHNECKNELIKHLFKEKLAQEISKDTFIDNLAQYYKEEE